MLQKAGLARAFRLGFAAGGQAWNRTVGVTAQRGTQPGGGSASQAPMDRGFIDAPRWVERVYDVFLILIAGLYRVPARLDCSIARSRCPKSGASSITGFLTAIRVMVLIALATLVWVPIGVWIGLRPKLTARAQPDRPVPGCFSDQPDLPGRRWC